MYLREIGKVNLLNAQGEKDLAKQVENGKIIKNFLRENAEQSNPNVHMLKTFTKNIAANLDLIKELKKHSKLEDYELTPYSLLTGQSEDILNGATKSEEEEQVLQLLLRSGLKISYVDFEMDKFVQFAQGNKKYFSYLG